MTKAAEWLLRDYKRVPTPKELAVSLAGFGITVVIAFIEDWRAADIIWAAWLASLLVGLSFYLVLTAGLIIDKARGKQLAADRGSSPGCLGAGSIGFIGLLAWLAGPGILRMVLASIAGLVLSSLIFTAAARRNETGPSEKEKPLRRGIAFIPAAVFMLFFFIGHFGGFHAGHAFFLSLLVPAELEVQAVIESFAGARELLFASFRGLLAVYWPYVAAVGVKSLFTYRDLLRAESKENSMILPYRNVVRIHLLIMVMAPAALANLGRPVMIIALFFFYFPIERVVGWARARRV